MSIAALRQFLVANEAEPRLVLATVYETVGSTYSKAGAQMLINAGGDFQGMLSGGCLEGDLAEHAARVVSDGVSQTVTYDMRDEEDELWGLGVGCEGMMRVLLQPLESNASFQPMSDVLEILEGETLGSIATVVASSVPEIKPGACLLSAGERVTVHGLSDVARDSVLDAISRERGERASTLLSLSIGCDVLVATLRPPPNVLVLGGGLDAQPLVRMCADLGWRVTVQDHRPGYIEKGDFGAARRVLCLPVSDVDTAVDVGSFDAVVVMSHHLATDREYLRMLSRYSMRYVGLLGPPRRRRRLMSALGAEASGLESRLRGPAGIDIGGRGPEAIALSIVAEMHRALMHDSEV